MACLGKEGCRVVVIFVRTAFFLVIVGILFGGYALISRVESTRPQVSYDEFLTSLGNDEVVKVHIKGHSLTYNDKFGREFSTYLPDTQLIIPKLLKKGVKITGESEQASPWWNVAYLFVPALLLLIAWYSILKRQEAGSEQDKQGEFAKKKVVELQKGGGRPVTFRDVAGNPEVKEELLEIIDFLQRPKKYLKIGATMPRGILFQGPPGTGKTLLARAVAGEAGVPFFSISGSDFVEMFVGVGASRVRELFSEAKKHAPCIIFIDEIDAVGGHRSAGNATGGQDERGQTLNALLVEMDGFQSDENVIVLAATNRPDILDPALLRPGRFDRQITILPPDIKGRLEILKVHTRKVSLAKNVDLEKIARSTPGFSGAELASLVNEAAIHAGRLGKKAVDNADFDFAKDRILMGVERKGLVISPKDKKTIAFHESGHAILAKFLPEADPIHKITIIPRGRALGHTQQLPMDDRHAYSKVYLKSRITILLAGRAAEELALRQQTTFAEDDFEQAVEIANKMVCRWGMTKSLGPVSLARADGGFLGEHYSAGSHSEETAKKIDQEVKKIVDECYQLACEILEREKDFLHQLAEMLLINETLDSEEMELVYQCTLKKRKASKASDQDNQEAYCSISDETKNKLTLIHEKRPGK